MRLGRPMSWFRILQHYYFLLMFCRLSCHVVESFFESFFLHYSCLVFSFTTAVSSFTNLDFVYFLKSQSVIPYVSR